jgi:aminoglycoside phosphotransferase (APT) family kinase protein
MPVPKARDPEETRRGLRDWLAAKQPDASRVEVLELDMPRTNGFSSETLMFEATWTRKGRREQHRLVARVAPTGYSIFPEYDLDRQRRVIEALGIHTEVPVPEVYWHEDGESSPFGQPFFVMERVEGRTPPDEPPYSKKGWLFDASPAEQSELWRNGLTELARIHAADWRALGLAFLDRSPTGVAGVGAMEAELDYYRRFQQWVAEGRDYPLLDRAFAWLEASVPADAGEGVCLNWGDARFGNMLFREFTPVAVLDWEMVTLGPPESDLSWWLAFHRSWTEFRNLPNLPGFLDRDRTISLYEELSGRRVRSFHFYEVWSAYRLAIIMRRFEDMLVRRGMLPADSPFKPHQPAWDLLAVVLDEEAD